MQLTAGS